MMATETESVAITTPADIETTPQGTVKRWLAEIDIASREEKAWRTEAEKLWKLYGGEKPKENSFNILWSNTETLQPALYNSTPAPDVRRRFRDADAVGKQASLVLERALAYEIDEGDFDSVMVDGVLDMLICGRGVLRVKYEPTLSPATEQAPEKLLDEHVSTEHVHWQDFRRGPGKTWDEVQWVAFRHEFTQDMAAEKFGAQVAGALKYQQGKDTEDLADKETRQIFKVVEVWEIWDRDARRVLFIAPSYNVAPCLLVPDPLSLKQFFPLPRPIYAIGNPTTLLPTPLYRLYEQQARELDRVSARINKTVSALKVRGAYAAQFPEVQQVIESDDNRLVPISNVSGLAEMGGLDKAIWIMPIDKLAQVLTGLYQSRDQIKQTIYEITGISDILRGQTEASETATAQRIKSQWGSLRLQKMQREVQRLARDLLRLQGEIIAERFTQETLAAVTGVELPTGQQKQSASQAVMQAQQAGQPIPLPLQQIMQKPSWDEVMQVLHSDALRCYRIDIETDSTVAESVSRDMEGLAEVTRALGELIAGAAPAVQSGMLTAESIKQIALTITRRARLGTPVEDALEELQGPQPQAQGDAMAQQIMQIVRTEGAKVVQQEQAQQQQAQGLQQYDQAIQQTLGQVAQVGQGAAVGLQQIGQQQAQQQQVLAALVQAVQAMSAQDQGTRGQVQQAMGGAVEQFTAAAQAVLAGVQSMTTTMQSVVEAVSKPKRIEFERDPKTRRVTSATATIQ